MPNWRILGPGSASRDCAHDHFSGVDAGPGFEDRASFGDMALGMRLELLLHPQGGIKGALRMVFVSDWRTEQREDTIAGRLHDVSVVALDCFDHHLQRRVNDGASFFGVEVCHQLG